VGNFVRDWEMSPREKALIFVDSCNQYHAAKQAFNGGRLNYRALHNYVTAEYEVRNAYAYVVRNPADPVQCRFFDAIRYQGFTLQVKDLRTHPDGTQEVNWDVGIALDAYVFANDNAINHVVLVSGDGDFVPLIKKLQSKGCHIMVMSFSKVLSRELAAEANKVILLDDPRFRYLTP